MVVRYCLSVATGGIGILVTKCCLRFSMCSPPCPSIRLADLLSNEEIARARIDHVVSGTPGAYHEFVQTQLQGSLVGIPITSVSQFPSEVKLHFIFSVSASMKISACCTFRLHLLKRRKRKKRIPLQAMLAALLIPSWRHILIFLDGNMM